MKDKRYLFWDLDGYGSRQELEDAGAEALAADIPALRRLFL